MFLYEKVIISIIIPKSILMKKNSIPLIDKKRIKTDNPPNKEPNIILLRFVFLFKMVFIPYRIIKSNKKLIKKT